MLSGNQENQASKAVAEAIVHDPVGESYLEILEDYPEYTRLIWKKVTDLVEIRGRVLEMGCGIGSISQLILRSGAVESLDGVDLNRTHIDRVSRRIEDSRFRAICASAEEYCPGEALYDRVVSINVLEHVRDDRQALLNLARMLRPGGECAILVPAHPSLFSSLDRGLSHHRRYSRPRFLELARLAGLDPERVAHFNPLGAVGWWLNGKVLHRPVLPRGQVLLYNRLLIALSSALDRINPLPLGISLIARLVKPL